MEPLPDFRTLSDDDLDRYIARLTKEEEEISRERRFLQGTLDIFLAERTARRKNGSLASPSIAELAAVLSRKGLPPELRPDPADG
jgi:hypothetical protein